MSKKSFKRGKRKNCLRCLPKIYSFLTENISLKTSESTQRQSRFTFLGSSNYAKVVFTEIKCNPCEETLCYFAILSDWKLSNNIWYKLQKKSPKKGLHHVCFPVKFPNIFRQLFYWTHPDSCFYLLIS